MSRHGSGIFKVDIVTTEFGSSPVEDIIRAFRAVHFDRYEKFIETIFFVPKGNGIALADGAGRGNYKPTVGAWKDRLGLMDPYRALEVATDLFLAGEFGTAPTPDLPPSAIKRPGPFDPGHEDTAAIHKFQSAWDSYFKAQGVHDATLEFEDAVAAAFEVVHSKGAPPGKTSHRKGYDLLHAFFMEIAGIRQAEGAILMRYQNQRVVGARGEALVQLNLDAEDSLNAWLKGRVEAYQQRRLTGLPERANEYFSQVGQSILPGDDTQPADVRVGLMPALLGLVRRLLAFYDAEDNKMVRADATSVLQSFKELQIKADEAEANRAYDMPLRIRKETLVATAILRHPTLWQALVARTQVRRAAEYQNVFEAVKEALGWDLADITHFQDLAYSAEILIGAGQVDVRKDEAWARVWDVKDAAAAASKLRNEAKSFAHAYRAVTGIDLAVPNVSLAVPAALVRVPIVSAGGRNVVRSADPVPRSARYPATVPPDGLSRRLR